MMKRFARTEFGKFVMFAAFITGLCQLAMVPLPGS